MSTGDKKLDEFESVFRSALHDVFHYQPPPLRRIALVSDTDSPDLEEARAFLRRSHGAGQVEWQAIPASLWAADRAAAIPTLVSHLDEISPDLVVTRRNLLSAVDAPFSLGSVVDTLTQAQPTPVLLLPDDLQERTIRSVMAVTPNMAGEDELVSWAATLTPEQGTLVLAHVEDDVTMQRYLDVIGRIRDISSDDANQRIPEKLLDIPRDYLARIQEVLAQQGISEQVVPIVQMGHALTDYRHLVDAHYVDLLVVNGRDDRQRAMHGLAHALAVEIRHRPLLML
ncbi:MAG: hypothetical protein KTR31_17600 [Myxococcales bacterium]|nr:hypothetical protein [Myxococcales bacterium]